MTTDVKIAETTSPSPSIPTSLVYQLSEQELKDLYLTVRECLRLHRLTSTDNLNVMSVRMSLDTCNKVRHLAAARRTTLSTVVRHAIDAYCKKEKR